MKLPLALSTCALPGKSVQAIETIALRYGWCMEFSSGFPYEDDLSGKFLKARCKKLIHNYFPTPQTPFVLNLASLNKGNWEQSIEHGLQGLRLAGIAKLPFYSIHSGFCFDPEPRELGKPLDHYRRQHLRAVYQKRFTQALTHLLKEAKAQGVDLLIENNVVSDVNKKVPLLCSDIKETLGLFEKMTARTSRLGLLLDTGHLKVSAHSLGYSTIEFVNKLEPYIRAFHHSDNDGRSDTNLPLPKDYWFLPFMPRFQKVMHVLEVVDLTPAQVAVQFKRLTSAAMVRKETTWSN